MGQRIRNISLKTIGSETLALGYAGENEHTLVNISCSSVYADYPDATVQMIVKPPQGDSYLAALTVDDNIVTWELTSGDTRYAGTGQYQMVFTDSDGEEILRSAIGSYRIADSLEPTGDAPDPIQTWIENANETARQIALEAARQATQYPASFVQIDSSNLYRIEF